MSGGETVREEAYRAAATAVDRFLERIGGHSDEAREAAGTAARGRFRAELGRVVDLNLDMVRNAFGMYSGLLDPEKFGQPKADRLEFGPTLADTTTSTIMWLHNFDDEPITDVGLVGSALAASEETALQRPRWTFTPPTITVPPRSAVPVRVDLEVPDGTPAGTYRGTVSPSAREGQEVSVLLEVVAPEAVEHGSW